MAKEYNEYMTDVDELEIGDEITWITRSGEVIHLTVKSIGQEEIKFKQGENIKKVSKNKLQNHMNDHQTDDPRGVKYKGISVK